MDAQSIFYTLGSVFMVMGILILLTIAIALIYLIKTVKKLQETIIEKVEAIKDSVSEPARVARGFGSAAAGMLAYGLKQFLNKKDK